MPADNKKNIMYAIGAGVALIGAAIIYSLVKGGGEGEGAEGEEQIVPEIATAEINDKLKKQGLSTVAYNAQGQIDNQYFLKLLQFVGAETRDLLADKRKESTNLRREAYKAENWDEYTRIVSDVIKLEDKAAGDILKEVLSSLNVQEQEFAMKHMQMSQDPNFAEFVMAAQQGKLQQPDTTKQPTLNKQETIKHLQTTAQVQLEQMQNMQSQMQNQVPPTDQEGQMQMMINMMVEQHKAQDKIFIVSGGKTENDDFEVALLHWCSRDPEVAQAMQQYMMKMRSAMPAGAQ